MSKNKRTILDDIADDVRGMLEELDRMLRGEHRKTARALVPAPVRRDPHEKKPYRQ